MNFFSLRSTLRRMNTIPKMKITIIIPLEFHLRIPSFGRDLEVIFESGFFSFTNSRYDRSRYHAKNIRI